MVNGEQIFLFKPLYRPGQVKSHCYVVSKIFMLAKNERGKLCDFWFHNKNFSICNLVTFEHKQRSFTFLIVYIIINGLSS